jgi:uncharacterized repeat protein (TIGR03803 family)
MKRNVFSYNSTAKTIIGEETNMKTAKLLLFLTMLLLVICCGLGKAHAQLALTLTPALQSGPAGTSTVFTFTGTLTNNGNVPVFLNADNISFTGIGWTIDDSPFFNNAPASLNPGQGTGLIGLFTVTNPSNAPAGNYSGTYSILGGATPADTNVLASEPFQVSLTPSASTPEVGSLTSLTLLFLLTATLTLHRFRNRKQAMRDLCKEVTMNKNVTLQLPSSTNRHRALLHLLFALLLGLAYPTMGRGQTFRPNVLPTYTSQPIVVLHAFSALNSGINADGANPRASVIVGSDGRIFGTSYYGGAFGNGVLFSVASDGSNFQVLHTFTGGNDGAIPSAIIQLPDGTLFGTAIEGGANGAGVVYSINPDGTQFQVVHTFAALQTPPLNLAPDAPNPNADGVGPHGLIQGADQALYGTTLSGGNLGFGVVFRLQLDGTFTVLHNFSDTDGNFPIGLLQGKDGALYGACDYSANGGGDLYKLLPDGSGFTVIHTFNAPGTASNSYVNVGGAVPFTYLVQDQNGSLYGTTLGGGAFGGGVFFRIQTDGSSYTLLHSFGGPSVLLPVSSNPSGRLVLGHNNTIYGTCQNGGSPSNGGGVLYAMPTFGNGFFVIHSFDFGTTTDNGGGPVGGLTLGPDGDFYGTTNGGGSNGTGVVFRYGPKVLALSPNGAAAGSSDLTLTVEGSGFTQFAQVLWNGQGLSTKQLNSQQLQATVPASLLASTGSATVQVTDGTLGTTTSPLIFLIGQPQLQIHLTSATRDQNNNVIVQLTFVNSGGATAGNLNLASAKLTDSSKNTVMATAGTGAIGDLPSGSSITVNLTFPASVVSGKGLLRVAGTYTQGSFGGSFRVNIP